MACNGNHPQTNKLIQISEQIFDPIEIPFRIGNDIYILHQQDTRKIEDTRHIAYYKCDSTSFLNPVNIPNSQNISDATCSRAQELPQPAFDESKIWDDITSAILAAQSAPMNPERAHLINKLLEVIRDHNSNRNYVAPLEEQAKYQCYDHNNLQKYICTPIYSKWRTKYKRNKFHNKCCSSYSSLSLDIPIEKKNRGTETCNFPHDTDEENEKCDVNFEIDESLDGNYFKKLLEKKKSDDVFS